MLTQTEGFSPMVDTKYQGMKFLSELAGRITLDLLSEESAAGLR